MNHPKNPHPYNPDAIGVTEIVIQPSDEVNDCRASACSAPRGILVRRKNGKVSVCYSPNMIGRTVPELIAIAKEDAKRIAGRVEIY